MIVTDEIKNKHIYLAPMEGVTDAIFRNCYKKYFGGVDKYYTPFLSPNATKQFVTKELRNIDPANNDVSCTVPQLITNNAEHFLWGVGEIAPLGYKEINLNLGCPSGTVVAKKKGSGMLYYPEELDNFLYDIFAGLPSGVEISVKTRLGKNDPEEFGKIFDIYSKYPISELTIHPRIQKDYYREPVRPEYFDYAYEKNYASEKPLPLVYNGDLQTPGDVLECFKKYPEINAVMLGRALVTNPMLFTGFDRNKFRAFHDELFARYKAILYGDTQVAFRMKEFWFYWSKNFENCEKPLKKIQKTTRLSEYENAVEEIFANN